MVQNATPLVFDHNNTVLKAYDVAYRKENLFIYFYFSILIYSPEFKTF